MLKIPVFVRVLIIADVLFCILYLIDNTIGGISYKLSDLLNLDSELSVANWYSSIKYFCMSMLVAFISINHYKINKAYISLGLFSLIFLAMSIDESAHIHEYVGWQLDAFLEGGSRENTMFSVTGIWMIAIGIPFILLFFSVLYSVNAALKNSSFRVKRAILGIMVLLGGALGVEAVSNFVENGLLILQITVEEGMEMIGVSILIWSVYNLSIESLRSLYSDQKE